MKKFVIKGELIDLNAYTNSQRANRFGGAQAKRRNTEQCAFYIRKAMREGLKVDHRDYPLNIAMNWYVPNKRKDKDNIAFAKKFIFDGMIEAGLIENDGWKQIGNFQDSFHVDKENPRIEVEIKGVKNE